MRIGVIFPQTEIGSDPGAIREYAHAVEDLGYHHLLAYDHVLGADPQAHPGFRGPYTHQTPFHEPFALFGYLAAITQRLELVTGHSRQGADVRLEFGDTWADTVTHSSIDLHGQIDGWSRTEWVRSKG